VDKKHEITLQEVGDQVMVITPASALDNTNAHEMVDAITTAQSAGRRFIAIDMSNLEFLSSAGVGSILGTVENSREIGGDIVLFSVPETIMHILSVLDLDEYLTIRSDRAQAAALCDSEFK